MLKSAKGILLVLFLYLGLAWTGSSYWYRDRPNAAKVIVDHGLWLTVVGLAALLIILLGSWLFGYWKAYRARVAARPKPMPVVAGKPLAGQDDIESLKFLLGEASARLIASPAFAKFQSAPHLVLSGLPLYLVVGVEGAGKTSVMANSGLDPELLAGQPRLEKSAPSSTGLANIWLAAGSVFIEIGGRHFAGDGRGWTELLKVLTAKPQIPLWRRLWKGDLPGFNIRGIIHCSELRFFLSKPGPEQIERQSQLAQERLRAIIKVFGKRLPVFTVFTKADQIPYFKDFFGRFSEREAEQILGCTMALPEAQRDLDQAAFATNESKRISKSFNALYLSLTERRLSVLFHEPNLARKSRIYEFPREFNRIKQSIVDFLVQTFRPSPLEPTPVNRGFYFSGTREVEPLPSASETSTKGFETVNIPFQQAMDATSLFKGDLAELMKGGGPDADLQVTRLRRGGFQTRWAFLSALFQNVVCRDESVDFFVPTVRANRFGSTLTFLPTLVLAVSVFLGLLWTISWAQNASLVQDVYEGTPTYSAAPVPTGELPSRQELESLQALRERVERLSESHKSSTVWNLWHLSMRFGLYQVETLRVPVREAYFRRLETSLLELTNSKLTSFLRSLGKSRDPKEARIASDRLRAYIMTTSSGKCMPEPQVVIASLTAMVEAAGMPFSDPRFPLAADQIQYYANELQFGTPVKLAADPDAQAHALQYVNSLSNEDQRYRQLVDAVARENGGIVKFVPAKERLLESPANQVSAAFTPMGWDMFQAKLESQNLGSLVEPCFSGATGNSSNKADLASKLSESEKNRLQDQYARDYFMSWRDFLYGFHVVRFANAREAAQKLEVLGGNNSPTLALLRFVGENTTFARLQPEAADAGLIGTSFQKLTKLFEPPKDIQFTLNRVEKAFQPVRAVVPVTGDLLITDKNRPYMDALGKLALAMDDIDRNANSDIQANRKGGEAAKEAQSAISVIGRDFSATSIGQVDDKVRALLKEPVDNASAVGNFDIREKDKNATDVNLSVRKVCQDFNLNVSRKYPFDAQSGQDLSFKDFTEWFVPDVGRIWMAQESLLSKIVVRTDNKIWKQVSGDLKPSSDLIAFLNRAQLITNAFFADVKNPGFEYTLRPKLANTLQTIQFSFDGNDHTWDNDNQRQKDLAWSPKSSSVSSFGRAGGKGNLVEFTSGSGIWGVFKMFHEGKRSGNSFTWTRATVSPVQLDFVAPPSGLVDVFDPSFFSIQCPQTGAVLQ